MSEIQELTTQRKEMEKLIEFRDTVLRLSANPLFQKVIHEEFCRDEAARLIRLAGDPNFDAKQRQDCLDMAMAAGHLQRFLSAKIQMGNQAEGSIQEIDLALEELRAEGGDE